MVDKIRQRAQSLLEKLHHKYGIQTKNQLHLIVEMGKKEGEGTGAQDHWYLVDTHGQKFRLPKTMLFLGREECDVVVASPSVDKRHAVLTFDLYLNRFKVKDLSTTNGTFVNNARIQEQEYVILQHMDSVRLGYDAMMYHIEQGSQITSQGGNLPDPRVIPSWASRRAPEPPTIHVHSHAMAECQGCIAEQNIEHSCGLHSERHEEDTRPNEHDSRFHNHHQQQQQHDQQTAQQSHQQQSASTTPTNDPSDLEPRDDNHPSLQETAGSSKSGNAHEELQAPENKEDDMSDSSKVTIRNTWPRKRVRQTPHVGSIFGPSEAAEKTDANISEVRPAGPMSAMYFVSFDDSVCNGSTTDLNVEKIQRIPRNSKNPLPAELSTVKKGTPLYGQPSWWGDGDSGSPQGAETVSKQNVKGGASKQDSRPSSLVLSNKEPSAMESDKRGSYPSARRVSSGSTYMEIPAHDSEDTPDNTGIPTSISKDSLFSPDGKLESVNKGSKEPSPSAEKNPAMSFTIDLDDRTKKVNMGVRLSNFVPSKMRRNIQERKDKAASTATKAGSKESTPSKNSEERELSPSRQRKIDELWNTFESKGKNSHLSSVHATAGSSLRSPNLEDIDRLSELSEERHSMEKEVEKKGSRKPVSSKSPQVSRTVRAKNASSSAKSAGSVSMSQYSDPTSYLIDKMFEGGSATPSSSVSSDKEKSPEQKLYREAASHDKTSRPADKGLTHSERRKSGQKAAKGNNNNVGKVETQRKDSVDDLKIVESSPIDDKEDKASEAGTYTIEVDEEEQDEVEAARRRIDEVFGVLNESAQAHGKPVIDMRLNSPGGYDNVADDIADGERTPQEEEVTTPMDDLVLHDGEEDDEDAEEDEEDEPDKMASAWISQLTALTSQKSAHASSDSQRASLDEGTMSLSKKPPHGLNRKRPGTGRKLPSIPTDRSPVSSEHSSFLGEQDFSNLEDPAPTKHADVPSASGKYGATFGPVVPHHQVGLKPAAFNGHAASPTSSRAVAEKGDASAEVSPKTSARSQGSVDTELLLKDTQTVMAAMEARMAFKSSNEHKNSHSLDDSDTDASSTAALVNGDEDYVKPTLFKSPREAMSKRQRDKTSKSTTSPSLQTQTLSSASKRAPARSLSQTSSSKLGLSSPRSLFSAVSGTKKSVVSDVFSRADSFENDSIISDGGSEAGEKSDSKGKGTITMTKPNRAFQLRRARADSADEPTTPRSGKSTASSRSSVPGASVRSSSSHSTSRLRSGLDSGRSDASLGAQIARKSRINNERAEKAKSISNLDRTDGGRFSLRLQRASSLTIAPQQSLTYPGKRETTPKSQLKSTSSNSRSNLSITGVNGVSRSQPGSRSNSPKSAERMAWKRRKEYDPRKAVAEAKTKSKDPVGSSSTSASRHKPSTKDNVKRKMIRSASFGNSSQLSVHDSMSSTHSSGLSSRREQQEGEQFRRAFIPFQNSHRTNHRSAHSADEDDSLASATSTQDSCRAVYNLEVQSQPKSAFTPPLLSKTSSSPDSPPPPAALSLRRRSLQGVAGSLSLSVAPPLSRNDEANSKAESSVMTPQISYDSLIVSSIYQLSLKLKTSTEKTLNKLREQDRVSFTPSPIDDFLADSGKSEITAWRSANQELAGILKNLRKIERHVQIVNRVVFPEDDMDSEVNTGLSGREKQKYFQEIERIRSELAGFHPIENPRRDDEVTSPEMEEFEDTF